MELELFLRESRQHVKMSLTVGILVTVVTLIYVVVVGTHVMRDYYLFRSQPQAAVAIGRTLLKKHLSREPQSETVFDALEEWSGANRKQERAGLTQLKPTTETERKLLNVLISSSIVEEKLLGAMLFLLGWYGHLITRVISAALIATTGLLVAVLAISNDFTAHRYVKVLERLAAR